MATVLLAAQAADTEYLHHLVMDHFLRVPGTRVTFRPHPVGTPGLYRDATFEINALGFRGRLPGPEDVKRILVLGGSTVEDIMLNDEDSWVGALDRALPGVWVGHAGRAGTTARHHVLQLERLLPQLPKLDAVVVLCGLNDMLASLGAHGVELTPTLGACFAAAPGLPAPEQLGGVHEYGETTQQFKRRRQAVYDADWLNSPLVGMGASLEAYQAALERLYEVVEAVGARLVLVTQPAVWSYHMGPEETSRLYAGGLDAPDRWWANPRCPWYRTEVLCEALHDHNNVICDLAGDRPVIDLALTLPPAAEFFYDDFHFSVAGATRVGALAADYLREVL